MELHFRKKHFKVEWFNNKHCGGQHANKHHNCCRITHIETGISATGTETKSREQNKRKALTRVCDKLLAHYMGPTESKPTVLERIRTYHEPRNVVTDEASGHQES